jgi:hypothetical protein
MKRDHLPGFALLLLVLAATAAAGTADDAARAAVATLDVRPAVTILTFPPLAGETGDQSHALGAVVALPADATTATATLLTGRAGEVKLAGKPMLQRGQPLVVVCVSDPGPEPITVAVHHDGDWGAKTSDRLASFGLRASLPGLPQADGAKSLAHPLGGSYVIICGPQFAGAVAPLADWKTRKGWPVVAVTTDQTGTTNAAIRAWLQEAYQTWSRPPEYVLLVGDVDVIPSWSFSGNVTDLPYQLLDGDDWLPDVMLGRFSVANQTECQALVAKTVYYEQSPYLDQTAWFTRGVMVAGQYGSTTPMHTVRYCGEQLGRLGFDPLVPVTPIQTTGNYIVSPYMPSDGIGIPQNLGPAVIKEAIDTGCSMVVYRGWAYGTAGWEPPHYTVNQIPALANGAMLPVVMSFVCLNGDFSASEPCFGEVFTRVGGNTPETFKGAVAFLGNGEHWSHTRHNDAMAISVFERITEPALTTLGSLLNAGKLRFMEFFPGTLDEIGDELSVEFYFHIYNVLGDPELNYYRALPTALAVSHPAALPAGATLVDVAVAEAGSLLPLAGARIGIAQGGQLLGAALTGADGIARVSLQTAAANGSVDLTVTHPDRLAYTAALNASTSDHFLALDSLAVSAAGDLAVPIQPGAELSLLPVMRNLGSQTSGEATLTWTAEGPAVVAAASAALGGLAPGATGEPATPFTMTVLPAAADGARIRGFLSAAHDGQTSESSYELVVSAPDLAVTAVTASGDGWVEPGTTTDLILTVANHGTLASDGGSLDLALTLPVGATLLTETIALPALAAGGGQATVGPVALQTDTALAGGTTLNVLVTATHLAGAVQELSFAIAVGRGDVTEPSGPDAYGYYAYDSADFLYPDQRPVYRWLEISTALGGPGTRLPFTIDNLDRNVVVDLPFTFKFYGEDFQRVRISDNGWLSFDADNDFYNFYNWPIPLAHGNAALVAPFWDNLTPEPFADPQSDPVGMDSDGIYWFYDEPAGEVIFEWSRMRHLYAEIAVLQTFQAVLRDPAVHAATPTGDGEILFFYKQISDSDHLRMYATVGIESPSETVGLELTYDGIRTRGFAPLGPGLAVRLTTAPPVRVPLTLAAFERQQQGDLAHLAWVYDDPRPVVGWRIHAAGPAGRTCLSAAALPAEARSCAVPADPETELILEALLPYGGVCEVGKAQADEIRLQFFLAEPLPNPMRGEAALAYALPRAGRVQLRIFDVRGRCVATLLDGPVEAGPGLVTWQGRDQRGRPVANGVYFYRLEHAGKILTRKLLLVR